MALTVSTSFNLTSWHTFGMAAFSQAALTVSSVEELKAALTTNGYHSLPKLILGGGSNVVFAEDYQGLIIRNRIMGREVEETVEEYLLHIGAGEDWDELIRWTLTEGMPGLENMALIPGTMGAAPIQNIGAYGAELAEFCRYVDFIDLDTFEQKRLDANDCQFGYRDSIFKRELLGKVAITAVGLALPKLWKPKLSYGPLQQLESPTPEKIYAKVVAVRQSKLPDPKLLGNAGSFFKNPIIDKQQYQQLLTEFADLPGYPDQDGVKVPAGWLIDRCQLKGYQVGGAAVHELQALVLVNKDNASADDVIALAKHVIAVVKARFGIELHPEVRILDGQGRLLWG